MPATLTLSPTTLPDDTIGTAYNQGVSASGGTAPYMFAVTTGTLPGGLTLDPNSGAITGTPTNTGTSSFTITATDNASDSGSQNYSVTINPALTFTTTTLPDTTVNTAYSQQLATSGGTGTPTFAVTTGTLPTGLTLTPAGLLSGTPTTAGSSTFTVTATDTAGATANQQYTVTANPVLAITTTTLPAATINTAYSQQLATSGGTGTPTFAVTTGTLPAGLTLSSAGLLAGTPTTAGTSTFTITATDTAGATANQQYSFTINPALTVTTTTLPNATVGTAYNQQLATSGGTGTPTFAVTTGTLPAGLSLSSAGLLAGTPTTAGSSAFTITATDANNATATHDYTLTVSAASTITLAPSTLPSATVGAPYNQQITGTGGTGTITFAVTTGALPAGLTLSNTGLISGTPTTAGTSTFTVTATDTTNATASQQYTLNVASAAATTGPAVTSLKRFGFHAQPTIFTLGFSTALDPTSAQDVANYTLVPLHNGTAGTPITLSSATYDAATNTVTLTPAHNVYLYAQYQLTVNGTSPSGVKDTAGNFLAGANGQSGTNYVQTFGKEVLSGPNIPSDTPAARADFINNEWTNELAARFAALAAAAGDTTTTPPAQSATVSAVRVVSHASPAVTLPASGALLPNAAHPDAIGTVLGAIVLPDHDKKK